MTEPPTTLNFDMDGISEATAAEYLRQAEMRHAAMYQAAIMMDQRSAVLAAAFVAASGAMAGGLMASLVAGTSIPRIAIGAVIVAIGLLLVAAACCGYVTRPQSTFMPGIHPSEWDAQEFLVRPTRELQLAQVVELQRILVVTQRRQARNARIFEAGLYTAAVAPVVILVALLHLV